MDIMSSKTILLGLIPVIGIGAGYFLLGPLKNLFKGKFGKHKKAQEAKENTVKELSTKQTEVVARIKNLEKADVATRKKVADRIEQANKDIEVIVKSDKKLQELATDFDNKW